jgi:hypothetical protein
MARVGKHAHVGAEFGDDRVGHQAIHPRNCDQASNLMFVGAHPLCDLCLQLGELAL